MISELENYEGSERFQFYIDNGIAFNLYAWEIDPDHVEEYSSVCVAVGREDLLIPEENC